MSNYSLLILVCVMHSVIRPDQLWSLGPAYLLYIQMYLIVLFCIDFKVRNNYHFCEGFLNGCRRIVCMFRTEEK